MKTIVVNFKTYPESTGRNALKLAGACDSVARRHRDVEIIVCPQHTDLAEVGKFKNIKVFAQHVDPVEPGKNTGSVTAFAVKEIGVSGTLVSHSEKKLALDEIGRCICSAKKYGLKTVVCSDGMARTKRILDFAPDYIAYEDPVLIGTGTPISKSKPDDVREFVGVVADANSRAVPLCGAGVSVSDDVRAAVELGTKGVILSSAFIKSDNPEKLLEEMAQALS